MRRDPRATANSFRAGGAKLAATNARASNAAACHSAASDEYRERAYASMRVCHDSNASIAASALSRRTHTRMCLA